MSQSGPPPLDDLDKTTAQSRSDKIISLVKALITELPQQEQERLLQDITKMLQPIPAPRAGDVLRTIARILSRKEKWTVGELKENIDAHGIRASPKEIYNALGYLTRKGRIRRIGYGRYAIGGVELVTSDDFGGPTARHEDAYRVMLVRLPRKAQWCQDAIERLKGTLPSCSRAVLFDERVIGITTMTEYTPVEILQQYGRELRPFESVSVIELGRLSASTDGLLDPFNFWIDVNVRRGERRECDDAEDVLKKKWGQRRIEHAENGGVANTLRKVFSRTRDR
jgi:hypothetical protein